MCRTCTWCRLQTARWMNRWHEILPGTSCGLALDLHSVKVIIGKPAVNERFYWLDIITTYLLIAPYIPRWVHRFASRFMCLTNERAKYVGSLWFTHAVARCDSSLRCWPFFFFVSILVDRSAVLYRRPPHNIPRIDAGWCRFVVTFSNHGIRHGWLETDRLPYYRVQNCDPKLYQIHFFIAHEVFKHLSLIGYV